MFDNKIITIQKVKDLIYALQNEFDNEFLKGLGRHEPYYVNVKFGVIGKHNGQTGTTEPLEIESQNRRRKGAVNVQYIKLFIYQLGDRKGTEGVA